MSAHSPSGSGSSARGHPDTLATRANLTRAYRSAGRTHDAVRLAERTLAETEHVGGTRHPDTLTASDAGEAYLGAGFGDQAIAAFQQTLADRERVLGRHIRTLSPRVPTLPTPTGRRASRRRQCRCTSGS